MLKHLFLIVTLFSIFSASSNELAKFEVINSNLLILNDDDSTPSFDSFKQYPSWQINEPIILEFADFWLANDFKALHFTPSNTKPDYADNNGFLSFSIQANSHFLKWQNQQTLTIDSRAFYKQMDDQNRPLLSAINLPFSTTYQIYVEFPEALSINEKSIKNYRIARFLTPEFETFKSTTITDSYLTSTWQQSLSEIELKNLQVSQQQHGKESAKEYLRSFDGSGVRIALLDDGILNNSNANKRVSFRLKAVDDSFLKGSARHGTAMANFITDYAPKVELLDFNIFSNWQHTYERLSEQFNHYHLKYGEYAQLANRLEVDLFNVSLVSKQLGNRAKDWLYAIDNGLVISKSLGNDKNIKQTIDDSDCSDPIHFLPYFALMHNVNLRQISGALVTLQAVIKIDNQYVSLRSAAGDAAPYTLSILETQRGATSQAAATFSGIFALLKQASDYYNRQYTGKQLVELLIETADDIGERGVDSIFGNGLVNIDRAITEIEKGYAPSVQLYSDLYYINNNNLEYIYNQGCQ